MLLRPEREDGGARRRYGHEMALLISRRRLLDVGVPAAIACGGLLDLLVVGGGFEGPRAVDAALLVAIAVPLVWRRRQPVWSLIASQLLIALYILALYRDVQPPIEPFIAGLVACFACGRYGRDRELRIGAAALFVGLAASGTAQLLEGQNPGNVIPVVLYWVAALVAGRFIRGRQGLIELLGNRTAELERQREREAERATLEERARIARELHDVIAHCVSVMVIQASAERRVLSPQHASTHEALATIERAGRESLAELRRLLGVLRAPGRTEALSPQPGLDALPALINDARAAGQEVAITIEGDPARLTAGIDLAAYRVVQEALTNARKHAPGARADITLRWRAEELELEIADDGPGAPAERNGAGHGLIGMRERVALYDGALDAGRATVSGGFRVRARLPITRGNEAR